MYDRDLIERLAIVYENDSTFRCLDGSFNWSTIDADLNKVSYHLSRLSCCIAGSEIANQINNGYEVGNPKFRAAPS